MTDEVRGEVIACRSYTHARRHPQVVGRIGGWALPTPMTPVQLCVLVGSFGFLLQTRALWAHLPGLANLLVLGGIPIALAWTVRHLRTEGRAPWRSALGIVTALGAPPGGVAHGRPRSRARSVRLRCPIVLVIGPHTPSPDPLRVGEDCDRGA